MTININKIISSELNIADWQVQRAIELFDEGATIPFVARYRKERTGELNEIHLRDISERLEYLKEIEARKQTILKTIDEQGKLTDILRKKIETCIQKTELEDLYLPYKPKRRTKATIARERGLEPLSDQLQALNLPDAPPADVDQIAKAFITDEVPDEKAALKGASDILAEHIAEQADFRAWVRAYLVSDGVFVAKIKPEFAEGTTKFEMYREYQSKVTEIAPHNMLALRRGEKEGILTFDLNYDEEAVYLWLESQIIKSKDQGVYDFYKSMVKDAFRRLMRITLLGEVRLLKKKEADTESISTFAENLRELLLASPAGMKPTLAIDPGFRTGCKVVALDNTGKFLEYQTIFPHNSARERERAAMTTARMVKAYDIKLVAIGNGTAGRETDQFMTENKAMFPTDMVKVMVNESGASIYSASQVAIDEFPDEDITVRGAVSIGRRLQDPLAELVKIDAKSIGVGQYQHDVDQKLLKKQLESTVESCVNFVGVNLNTASKELLEFVSGITPVLAGNIITYRNENGAFPDRKSLMNVPRLGPSAFQQAAGFLRIRNGSNPLDNTAVHPERYKLVKMMAKDQGVEVAELAGRLSQTGITKYVTDDIGAPTLDDILEELKKPGRDPREAFTYATFQEGVNDIKDLVTGQKLEGVVTNVTNFGAFVDIGVHQDGLVHISQLADRYVDKPTDIVKVGQVVQVRVMEVNIQLKRIALSMRSEASDSGEAKPKGSSGSRNSGRRNTNSNASRNAGQNANRNQGRNQSTNQSKPKAEGFTLEDLKAKFNRR